MAETNTVLLVDDHDLIRQGLARAFERHEDFTVVGEAGSVAEGLDWPPPLKPAVVVTDVRLPDGTGLDLVRTLRRRQPGHGHRRPDDVRRRRAAVRGARGRRLRLRRQGRPVRRRGGRARHATGLPAVVHRCQPRRRHAPQDVAHRSAAFPARARGLRLLAEGLGVAAIARQLFVSESTAKTHISKIYEKLGAGNRAQAIMNAIRAGLLSNETTLSTSTPKYSPIGLSSPSPIGHSAVRLSPFSRYSAACLRGFL